MRDPFKYTKKLFSAKTSGKLRVSKDQLEGYLENTYGDSRREEELPYMPGLVRPTEPGVQFDLGPLKVKQLETFLRNARSASCLLQVQMGHYLTME